MIDKKKSDWDRLATKEDVFNAMAAFVVTVSLSIIIGFTFLI
jgi:hypothetical protein